MGTVRIASKLPDDEQLNGLGSIHENALIAPLAPLWAVVELHVDKLLRDVRSGETVVILRIVRVEVGAGDDATVLRDVAASAVEDRLGVTRLPLVIEHGDTGS